MKVRNIEIHKDVIWFDLEGCEGIGDGKVGVTDSGDIVTEDGLSTEPSNDRQHFLVGVLLKHKDDSKSIPLETKKRFLS